MKRMAAEILVDIRVFILKTPHRIAPEYLGLL